MGCAICWNSFSMKRTLSSEYLGHRAVPVPCGPDNPPTGAEIAIDRGLHASSESVAMGESLTEIPSSQTSCGHLSDPEVTSECAERRNGRQAGNGHGGLAQPPGSRPRKAGERDHPRQARYHEDPTQRTHREGDPDAVPTSG